MSSIKFVQVPMDKYYEFIKSATESEDIVECATYAILADSCKAVSSVGLS
jgi:hypothetical protein